MPIAKKWSPFTLERLRLVPNEPGVYELGDMKGEVVYIGNGDSARGVRGRLNFHKKGKPKSVKYFRFTLASLFESPIDMETEHCDLLFEGYGGRPRLQKRMPRGYIVRL